MIERDRILGAVRRSWSSGMSTKWTLANPAAGQCSVTALVVQDHFGGRLLKTRVGDAWHFYNELAGEACDFTSQQFTCPVEYTHAAATREEVLADTSAEQYERMTKAFVTNWRDAIK